MYHLPFKRIITKLYNRNKYNNMVKIVSDDIIQAMFNFSLFGERYGF